MRNHWHDFRILYQLLKISFYSDSILLKSAAILNQLNKVISYVEWVSKTFKYLLMTDSIASFCRATASRFQIKDEICCFHHFAAYWVHLWATIEKIWIRNHCSLNFLFFSLHTQYVFCICFKYNLRYSESISMYLKVTGYENFLLNKRL